MKKVTLILLALMSTGCMTKNATLKRSIEATPFVAKDSQTIGLAPTKDSRSEEKVGHIGLLDIAVGGSLTPYADGVLKQRLSQAGFNVVSAPNPTEAKGAYVFNAKILAVNVFQLSLNTMDALMQPADVSVNLNATVYDKDGKEIYKAIYDGRNSEIVGIVGPSGETEGAIVAVAVDNAINKLVGDSNLRKAIQSQPEPVPAKVETESTVEVKKDQPAVATDNSSVTERLKKLKSLKDEGILTNKEYESRRKALVDKL